MRRSGAVGGGTVGEGGMSALKRILSPKLGGRVNAGGG